VIVINELKEHEERIRRYEEEIEMLEMSYRRDSIMFMALIISGLIIIIRSVIDM
jgi:hypothetical protein